MACSLYTPSVPSKMICPLRFVDVLDIRIGEARDLVVRPSNANSEHRICCVIKVDNEEIHSTSVPVKAPNAYFGEDYHLTVQKKFRVLSFYLFDQYSGRVSRPLGRLSFRKEEIVHYSGQEHWFDLRPFNRQSDVTGKVCLEVSNICSRQCADDNKWHLRVRMVDVCDLSLPVCRNTEVYALLRVQGDGENNFCSDTKKLRVSRTSTTECCSDDDSCSVAFSLPVPVIGDELFHDENRTSDHDHVVVYNCVNKKSSSRAAGQLCLRLSVWHDMPRSFSTFFHGEVRVPLVDPRQFDQNKTAWYYLKPRARTSVHQSSGVKDDKHGSIKLLMKYTVDHVLSSPQYNELSSLLTRSLTVQPFRASVVGLLSCLPKGESDRVVLPLVRSFLYSNQVRQFIHALCTEEITHCQEVNTLFRNYSFASRCIFEIMKMVGQHYLTGTLTPCFDKIYAERKCCEVDPGRIPAGQNVLETSKNLVHYTEFTLCRIVESSNRCPRLLREIFKTMRDVTAKHFPNRVDVQWLVLSSFLIMRFFAAALVNPKAFGLRHDNPDTNVNRCLALISKLIQRLSNFVVCGRKLSDKEAFMIPIWERFSDERHRLAFVKFFDKVSGGQRPNENGLPLVVNGAENNVTLLKEGLLYEYMDNTNDAHCFGRRCPSNKLRRCFLTETEFYWCKQKDCTRVGYIHVGDMVFIQPVEKRQSGRLMFQISTRNMHMYWEAASNSEMGEWIALLKKTCKRQQFSSQHQDTANNMFEIDIDHQLECIHLYFLRFIETFRTWKEYLASDGLSAGQDYSRPQFLSDSSLRSLLMESLESILCCTFTLEENHRAALIAHLKQTQYGSKELPIGDDNYLLLRSRMRECPSVSSNGSTSRSLPSPHQIEGIIEAPSSCHSFAPTQTTLGPQSAECNH